MASTGSGFFSANAACSSGTAQAGGFLGSLPVQGAGFNHILADSYRSSNKTWLSRTRSSVVGDTLTSYVYCAEAKKPAARSGSVLAATLNTRHTAVSAACKRNTKLAAGGFSQPDSSLAPLGNFFLFYESFKTGKAWRTSAFHDGIRSTTLNSIAYCG